MNADPGRSLRSSTLHRLPPDDALKLVEKHVGTPGDWPTSDVVRFRLTDESQLDWRIEVGNWLAAAATYGFVETLRINRARTAPARPEDVDRNPNDQVHRILWQELAGACAAHYLGATGWKFVAWEPSLATSGDVDVLMDAPDGTRARIQVKAPDLPGAIVNHRLVDGEHDDWVVTALRKGAKQLSGSVGEANIVWIMANRNWPITSYPRAVMVDVIGSTMGDESGNVSLWRSRCGNFWRDDWKHVSAVALLDYVRPPSDTYYSLVVYLNPNATTPAKPDWFPYGRVLELQGDRFHWHGGEPGDRLIPTGTLFLENE